MSQTETLTPRPAAPTGAAQRPSDPAAWPVPSRTSRMLSLLYGSIAYAAFFGTFLYAIGFVTGIFVPTTVDGGISAPLAEALLVNGGLLALFAVQHTIMARKAFKQRWTRIVPQQIERSTFVLVTCAIFYAIFTQWRHIPGTLWEVTGTFAWLLTGVALLGWGIVLLSSLLIDHFELFGLRQVVRHFLGKPPAAPEFRERSLYRVVRHPLMLGFLIAFWATPVMTMGHLFFAVMCTGYILFGIQVEERSLIAEHGESYLDYKDRVPMLLPIGRGRA